MAASRAPVRRGRSAKAALSRSVVLDAALEIVRSEGIDALTMRRLALALDTGPASLYVYFANREELLAAAFDQIVATVEIEPVDPARWREQALDHLVRSREVMDRYPGIARVALAKVPDGNNALKGADALIGFLRAGGFSDTTVSWAADVLFLYVTAAALETTVRDDDDYEVYEAVRTRFTSLPPEEYPNIAAVGPAIFSGDNDKRFRFGLELMLNGLETTRAAE